MPLPIHLLSQRPNVTEQELLELHPGPVVACDCYVVGAELWEVVPGGFARGRLMNIDHHAPVPQMARAVSSANLALERLRLVGPPSRDSLIVITHTDCDSVLSAGLMAGVLEADARYGDAALAADHTGEVNDIADLLQALDRRRDLSLSLAMLAALERDETLPQDVRAAVAHRAAERESAVAYVRAGRVQRHGPIAVIDIDQPVDGEFFAPILPDAALIVQARPHEDDASRLELKLRLGRAAVAGASLHALELSAFDPTYGGRWNAGSNRRGGGTVQSLAEVVGFLEGRVGRLS